MLGLGIGENIHYVVYGVSFAVAFAALLYRSEIGILFLVPLFPIYSVLSKALKSELPLANNITDFIIIGMLLGWAFQRSREQEFTLPSPPISLPLILTLLYSLFSYLIGISLFGGIGSEINVERLSTWKNYAIMPLLYVITYYNLRDRKWINILFGLLFLSFFAADIKFRQSFQWVKHTHYMDKSRLSGTLGFLGPNEMGGFHAIYTLFFIGILLVDKNKWRRIAYSLLIVGGIYSAMYSYSRGAYIGLLFGAVFISIIRARMLLIPLLAFLLMWKSIVPLSVVERVEGTFVEEGAQSDTVSVGGAELATAGRTDIWSNALDYFSQNPITGKGFNTFIFLTGWDTHNVYLKFLVEQGVIGTALFIWLYILALRSGWRLYQQGDDELTRALGFGFLCAVVGSMVVNFFGDRWTYLQIGGVYWVLWALVDQSLARCSLKESDSTKVTFYESLKRSNQKKLEVAKAALTSREKQS